MVRRYLLTKRQFEKIKKEVENNNSSELYMNSINLLRESLVKFPRHCGLHYLLALTYFMSNEHLKGISNFKIGIKYSETKSEYLSLISNCLLFMNDIESAYYSAHKAYEEDNKDVYALMVLSQIELKKYNYEDALFYIMNAIEIDSKNYFAIKILSKINIGMGLSVEEILKVLYKAREFGSDEDLSLDVIKFQYISEDYMGCLTECKNIVLKNKSGYAVEKATKYVSDIYNKIEKNKEQKNINNIKFSYSQIVEEIFEFIENGKLIKNDEFKLSYENSKRDFLQEIRAEMREIRNLSLINNNIEEKLLENSIIYDLLDESTIV